MQQLGRADAIEDRQAGLLAPATENIRRESFTGRNTEPD